MPNTSDREDVIMVVDAREEDQDQPELAKPTEDPPAPTPGSGDETQPNPPDQQSRPQANSAPFSCNLCGKLYSRIGHLARHHRAHTQSKPFTCEVCGKDFTRGDVLKRHLEQHVDGPSKRRRTSDEPRNSRVAKACIPCAASKLKCDSEKPCLRCKQRGIDCTTTSSTIQRRSSQNWDQSTRASGDQFFGFSDGASDDYRMRRLPSPENTQDDSSAASPQDTLKPLRPLRFSVDSQAQTFTIPPTSPGLLDATSPRMADRTTADQVDHLDPALQPAINVLVHEILNNGHEGPVDTQSFTAFLNDILMPLTPDQAVDHQRGETSFNDTPMQFSRDFLNFGMDPSPFFEVDWSVTPRVLDPASDAHSRTAHQPASSGTKTPMNPDLVNLRAVAFENSMWKYTPGHIDSAAMEQLNLSVPVGLGDSPETVLAARTQVSAQNLTTSVRDKILGLVLSTCGRQAVPDIVSSFPGLELMNSLMHHWLNTHALQLESWLHLPTFDVETVRLQLLVMIIAAGAISCSQPMTQCLGFSLQETVRLLLQREFDVDNQRSRDLQFIQTFCLQVEVGLWSGNNRKMEISEAFMLPVITMMRRGGFFTRSAVPIRAPTMDDDAEILDQKWRDWVHAESFKRLGYHLMIHDAQCSMAMQTTPLISHGELSLDLPAAKQLWMAPDAYEWRKHYIQLHSESSSDTFPASHYIYDMSKLKLRHRNDMALSAVIVIYATWTLVWSYLQLNSMLEQQQQAGEQPFHFASSQSWHQELVQLLERIRMSLDDWDHRARRHMDVLVQRILLNMHVSFSQLQNFAGKEGVEVARRTVPQLKRWYESSRSREAVWHAGQILRIAGQSAARGEPIMHFDAICVYHASMTFWAYATARLIDKKKRHQVGEMPWESQQLEGLSMEELVWLDSPASDLTQRFISLNRGLPVVSDWQNSMGASSPVYLHDAKAMMDTCSSVLRRGPAEGNTDQPLPLVGNLCKLMRDLGNASRGLHVS